jgi:tetratricopeptide (TPR) repeat protein
VIDEVALTNYVERLRTLRALAGRAVREKSNDASALYGAAGLFRRCGDLEAALSALTRATSLEPGAAAMWYELGQTQKFLGRMTEAEAAYRRALAADANAYRARYALALARRLSQADRAELQMLFGEAGDAHGWARLHIGHALAKASEEDGDLGASFAWLQRAKARRRQLAPYDDVRERALVDAAIGAFSSIAAAGADEPPADPIFVVGLPRSGTTLVERILSSHPQVSSAGELGNFPVLFNLMAGAAPDTREPSAFLAASRVDYKRLGRLYIESTRPLTGEKPRFVDKAPSNYFSAGAILRALPNARVVCVRRDPVESVLSNYRQLFATEDRYYDYAYGLDSAAQKYVQFARLAAHWRASLPPDRYMELRYEQLVADQEGQTRALLGFCGLAWNPACLDFHRNIAGVATPSAAQVRQPIYTSAVSRAPTYGALLDPARRVLETAGLA